MTPAPRRSTPAMATINMSHHYLRDLLEDVRADQEQHDPHDERESAQVGVEERVEPRGVDDEDPPGEHDGEGGQDPAREAPLGGEDLDQTPELHLAADVVHDSVEDLGRVPAGFAGKS